MANTRGLKSASGRLKSFTARLDSAHASFKSAGYSLNTYASPISFDYCRSILPIAALVGKTPLLSALCEANPSTHGHLAPPLSGDNASAVKASSSRFH